MKRCFLIFMIFLAGCVFEPQDGAPAYHVDVTKISNAKPKVEKKSRYGNPATYVVHGKRYYTLKSAKGYKAVGIASWYGTKFHNRLTSNREPFSLYKMTAAHRSLPLPTYVKVTNLENHRQIIVKVNDRGPFSKNRIIDLSYVAAKKLGILKKGTGLVRVEAIDPKTFYAKKKAKKQYYVQVAAFSDFIKAQILVEKLRRQINFPIQIAHQRSLYRVQIGPLKNANILIKKLEKLGYRHSITASK